MILVVVLVYSQINIWLWTKRADVMETKSFLGFSQIQLLGNLILKAGPWLFFAFQPYK